LEELEKQKIENQAEVDLKMERQNELKDERENLLALIQKQKESLAIQHQEQQKSTSEK